MEGTLSGGKKWASGTATTYKSSKADSGYQVHVSGLGFSPKAVILTIDGEIFPIVVCSAYNGETAYRYGSSSYGFTVYTTTVDESAAKAFVSKDGFKFSTSIYLNKAVKWVAFE